MILHAQFATLREETSISIKLWEELQEMIPRLNLLDPERAS